MELNELKKTWSKMTPSKELDENQLNTMLSKRTSSLIERIDRNIKIGFIILLGLIVLFTFDDIFYSSEKIESLSKTPLPDWNTYLSIFVNVLIVSSFLYFAIKYYMVKRHCDVTCDLKGTLTKIIETLILYQRLFYITLTSIIITMLSAFSTGMYIGLHQKAEKQGLHIADMEAVNPFVPIVFSILVIVLIGGVFLFLRWGFRKLYGNYIKKLKATLLELEELD
nr:hypothetical protein [uncultured Draconibacterium sp.]